MYYFTMTYFKDILSKLFVFFICIPIFIGLISIPSYKQFHEIQIEYRNISNTTVICSTFKMNIIDFSNITNNRNISTPYMCNSINEFPISEKEFMSVFIFMQCCIFIIMLAILNIIFDILFFCCFVSFTLIKLMWYIIYGSCHFIFSYFTTDNKEKIKVA